MKTNEEKDNKRSGAQVHKPASAKAQAVKNHPSAEQQSENLINRFDHPWTQTEATQIARSGEYQNRAKAQPSTGHTIGEIKIVSTTPFHQRWNALNEHRPGNEQLRGLRKSRPVIALRMQDQSR
jgi:hypothetical protein